MADIKQERRSQRRIPAQVPVSIKTQEGQPPTAGYTRDLSARGVFLYTGLPIGEGNDLEMVLMLPPEFTQGEKLWVCCQASVVRVEQDSENGRFGVAACIRSIEILPEGEG